MTATQKAIGVIAILHAVGVAGVLLGLADWIWPLTPLNLLVSGGIALGMAWPRRTWWWLAVAASGYLAEVVGVQTGWLFGTYSYSGVLGPRVAGVPVLLGWMWLLLLQGSRFEVGGRVLNAALGATLMVGMDALIEPVAIRAGWWAWAEVEATWWGLDGFEWAGQIIPHWNFVSWWLVSFVLLLFAPERAEHPRVWRWLFGVMAVFFLVLNVIEWT